MNKLKDWENPYVTQRNRYPMHTPYGAYESVEQALSNDRNASAFVMSLNGMWKFRIYQCPEEAEPFWQTDFDCSDWQSIPARSTCTSIICGVSALTCSSTIFPNSRN